MNVFDAKKVYDLDQFLPPDGEDRVNIIYEDTALILEIFYASPTDQVEYKRIIEFTHADYFIKTPFPGYSLFGSEQETDISLLNSIIEFGKSDLIVATNSDQGVGLRKHYRIFFHSVGIALDVVSEACKIHDASSAL